MMTGIVEKRKKNQIKEQVAKQALSASSAQGDCKYGEKKSKDFHVLTVEIAFNDWVNR